MKLLKPFLINQLEKNKEILSLLEQNYVKFVYYNKDDIESITLSDEIKENTIKNLNRHINYIKEQLNK